MPSLHGDDASDKGAPAEAATTHTEASNANDNAEANATKKCRS